MKDVEFWVPREAEKVSFGDSLPDIVEGYRLFLEVRHPEHHLRFRLQLEANKDGATAEAIVFSWLRLLRLTPTVSEGASTGGPDFLCHTPEGFAFLVEATSLNVKAVEERSGWPNELDDTVRAFSMITPNLWSKALHKAGQLADQEFPRLLAICLNHVGASALVSTFAARLLALDPNKAPFYRLVGGQYQPERRSISALLLIAVWADQIETLGMLHPDPIKEFDYRALSDVPFLRVKWPPSGDKVETEWVVAHPAPSRAFHARVVLTDQELRGS